MKVKVVVKHSNRVLSLSCDVADHALARMKGLLGRSNLGESEGLWIRPCNNIHMWFMRFAIDVVFIKPANGNFLVTSTHAGIPAWKLLPLIDLRATDVLELPIGTIERTQVKVGDTLCIS